LGVTDLVSPTLFPFAKVTVLKTSHPELVQSVGGEPPTSKSQLSPNISFPGIFLFLKVSFRFLMEIL